MAKDKKIKILVVDDDPSIRDVYSMKMESEGFEVSSAVNGKEGLEQALAKTPDMILLDIMMPVMDGLEMLSALRQMNDYGQKVPVMLLTNVSAGDEHIIEGVAKTSPISYLIKANVSLDEMVKKIREYFSAPK